MPLMLLAVHGLLLSNPTCLATPARRCAACALRAGGPSFWERLMYGRSGKKADVDEARVGKATEEAKPRSRYVPPEQWVDMETEAALAWERRVRHDAQAGGDQWRQNEVLGREIGKG